MRNTCIYTLVCLLLQLSYGCTETVDHRGKTPLVQVGKNFLYKEDVVSVIPPGVSLKDSAHMADRYIKNWIDDALLYIKAEGNIPDNAEIDE